jgi:putative transposase
VVGFRVVGVAHREVGPSAGFSVCTGKYSPRRSHRWRCPSLSHLSSSRRSVLGRAWIWSVSRSKLVLQELIETEAAERIGADRYERTDTRVTDRNGARPRLLATQAGDVQLRIPKLRKGSFFSVILEPRRRIDQALYAVVMEAYVNGVSTRSVEDLVVALASIRGAPVRRCRASVPDSMRS